MDTPRDIVQSMSDQYDIISPMNDIKETWYKWDYVCSDCDSNIEMTIKSNGHKHSEVCPKCYQPLTLVSVVDVTIEPSTTKKEETNMETLTPAQTITLTWKNNGVDETTTYTENDVRSTIYNNKRYGEKMNEYYRKQSQLRTLLEEVYADSNEQETLAQIAEIFDIPLEREVEYTATVSVYGTVTVRLGEDDFSLDDAIRSGLEVHSNDFEVNDWTVDNVEENG